MNCPHCGEFVPDNNYRCPKCKKAVQEAVDPAQFRTQQVNKQRSNSQTTSFIMIIVIISVAVLAYLMFFKSSESEEAEPTTSPAPTASRSTPAPQATAVRPPETTEDSADDGFDSDEAGFAGALKTGRVLNHGNPGGEVLIEEFVQGDQITIFNFHSQFSPLCMKYTPWLMQLDQKRNDIVVFRIDVNRPGISGLDIHSPVAQQFGLERLPYFVVYQADGTRSHDGQEARNYIEQLIRKAGIIKK